MEKEEVYKRVDDYLNYVANPINKTHIKFDKHNAIDADAIRTLKRYKLVSYRYPLDENSSMVDITMAGTRANAAGGIEKYIDLIENRPNVSAIVSPVGHSDFSNRPDNSLNFRNNDKKSVFVKFKKPAPDNSYLIIGAVVVLLAVYLTLHYLQVINF
jgi:hypothetical protein